MKSGNAARREFMRQRRGITLQKNWDAPDMTAATFRFRVIVVQHKRMIEDQAKSDAYITKAATAEFPPIPSDSCRGRRIINSDQVECMTPLCQSCKFMLSIGRTHICRHPLRLEIAARGF